MINSILIGKLIYGKLSNNTLIKLKCTGKIDNENKLKIYPLIANSKTTFPYITFKKDNVSSNVCKDGYYEDIVTFSIAVTDINYDTSCEIANEIRNIFNLNRITFNNITILNCRLTGIDEIWNEEAFILMLSFECKINNI